MAKQIVNIGANANDGSGDAARSAFMKINQNMNEIYDKFGDGDNLINRSIGINQAWKSLTNDRVANTKYLNNTDKPIVVCAQIWVRNVVYNAYVDDILVGSIRGNIYEVMSFIVPPMSTYSILTETNPPMSTFQSWSELRV